MPPWTIWISRSLRPTASYKRRDCTFAASALASRIFVGHVSMTTSLIPELNMSERFCVARTTTAFSLRNVFSQSRRYSPKKVQQYGNCGLVIAIAILHEVLHLEHHHAAVPQPILVRIEQTAKRPSERVN